MGWTVKIEKDLLYTEYDVWIRWKRFVFKPSYDVILTKNLEICCNDVFSWRADVIIGFILRALEKWEQRLYFSFLTFLVAVSSLFALTIDLHV